MRYMLLIYFEEQELAEDVREACYVKSVALTQDLHA